MYSSYNGYSLLDGELIKSGADENLPYNDGRRAMMSAFSEG